MRILSRISILIFFLFFISYFSFLISPAFAQDKTAPPPSPNVETSIPNNLHSWTQNVMIEVMLSLTCQLVGVDPTTPDKQCLGVDQKTGKIGFLPAGNLEKGEVGGAIGGMNNMISMLYTPPIHTSDYFQNLAQNFGITKKTYAQQTGTGFDGLRPLLNVWTAFRNIVYLIFVIVFVVIGLAIMLRVKIDPRTVMTIQNQIPKIIIGILLVTFSFAIAGFMIDLMWVLIHLIFGLISGISTDIASNVRTLNPTQLQGKNPFEAVSAWNITNMAGTVAARSIGIVQEILGIGADATNITGLGLPKDIIGFIISLLPGDFPINGGSPFNFLIDLLSAIGAISLGIKVGTMPALQVEGSFLGFGGGTNLAGLTINLIAAATVGGMVYTLIQEFLRFGVPFLIVFIIIFLALFMALFKLWFALLMAYISILIDVALAPFWIMGSLIPGSPISAGGWLRDMIANLAAFPAVIFMLLLGRVFMDGFAKAKNGFIPPLIGDFGNQNMFSSLIGIGIIIMTPSVVGMVKTALKAPKIDTSGVGKAIGGAVGLPISTGKSIGSTIMGSREYIAGPGGFRQRTLAESILGGIVGRR